MKCKFWLVLIAIASAMLSACGSAPMVRDSKVLNMPAQKVAFLRFIYRQSEMKTVSSYGRGSVPYGENGFSEFGPLLAKRAADTFAKYQVKVSESIRTDAKESIVIKPDNLDVPVLLVYPSKGTIVNNLHASRATFVFDAQIIDFSAKKILWKASIDTDTWSGRDFITESAKPTLYDEAYADQLLKTLADRMREDGVI